MAERRLRLNSLRGRELQKPIQSSKDDKLSPTTETAMEAAGKTMLSSSKNFKNNEKPYVHVTVNNNFEKIIHDNTNNRDQAPDTKMNKMSTNASEKPDKEDVGGWNDLSRRNEADMTMPPEILPVPEPGEGPDPVAPPENIPTPEKSVAPEIPSPESRSPEIPMRATKAPDSTEVPEEAAAMTKAPNDLSPGKPLAEQHTHQTKHPSSSSASSSSSCNTLSCQGLGILNDHPLLYIPLVFVFVFLCCLKFKKICGGGRRNRDPRGEYRAVGRMLANNFDTELTEEDMNFGWASDEEDDDPNSFAHNNGNNNKNSSGWSQYNSKGTIELGSVGVDEENGGLTLEEMNG